jgi:hypothetical protein
MAAWLSVAIGGVVAIMMITASLWSLFQPRPEGKRPIPRRAKTRATPTVKNVAGSGNDHP